MYQQQSQRDVLHAKDTSSKETSLRNKAAWRQLSQEQPKSESKEGDKLGRQGGSCSQEQPKRDKSGKPRTETSLGDKAAGVAKSRPERKLSRETSLGEKATAAGKNCPEGNIVGWQAWETRWQRRPGAAHKGNHKGRQGGSDKFTINQQFGNQYPSHWEVRTPIAFSYLRQMDFDTLRENECSVAFIPKHNLRTYIRTCFKNLARHGLWRPKKQDALDLRESTQTSSTLGHSTLQFPPEKMEPSTYHHFWQRAQVTAACCIAIRQSNEVIKGLEGLWGFSIQGKLWYPRAPTTFAVSVVLALEAWRCIIYIYIFLYLLRR